MAPTPPFVALLLLVLLAGAPPAGAAEAEVGALHPELRLPTLDGKRTLSLRSLHGRKVLLIEFASW